ncbi:type III-A CRISPR-associated RAMP protein Csm5 [Colibacter massiliensis]|uniref:type III-A CRISPR-associated RAMP protein Csm5 n=1 Tax=Colibacter massiliensis TaxID=1852379 RepID=UPI00266BC6B2|nr:type III-A CRISPR-associated RAMP protein Csm5 [Colibacter massiliensis]
MLKENGHIQAQELEIKVITPTHVGNGALLNKHDYLYSPQKHRVYFLHEGKWFTWLEGSHLLEEYITFLQSSRAKTTSTTKWLAWQNLGVEKSLDYFTQVSYSHMNANENLNNDLRIMERTVSWGPYIPGSTLKGMLRTALLHCAIKRDTQCAKNLRHKLTDSVLKEKRFKFPESEWFKENEPDVNGLMRAIRWSDAVGTDLETASCQKYEFPLNQRKERKTLPIYYECLVPNSRLRTTLSLDMSELERVREQSKQLLPITGVDDLLSYLLEYHKDINSLLEEEFSCSWREIFRFQHETNAYIGANIGFLQKTNLLAMAGTSREWLYKTAKNILPHKMGKTVIKRNSDKINPANLKGTMYAGKPCMMGGISIRKV